MQVKAFVYFIIILIVSCSPLSQRQEYYGDSTVLNSMHLGLSALSNSDSSSALNELSKAASLNLAIWTNLAGAKKASSLWYDEEAKEFKGEPYERAMLNYYLGVLYLGLQDFGNAQAAFKQGILSDITGKDGKIDFKLLLLLEGISLRYLKSSSAELSFKEYTTQAPLPFDINSLPNLIVLFDRGIGPKKISIDEATLDYVRRYTQEKITIAVDASNANALASDVYEIAKSHGLRMADEYNLSKKSVKKTTKDVGEFGVNTGRELLNSDDKNIALLGAAVTLGGLATGFFSENVVVKPDTRYWQNLPGAIYSAFFTVKPGKHRLLIKNQLDNSILINKQIDFSDTEKLKVIYLSDQLR